MDGSHPDNDPVPNTHTVELEWWRTSIEVTGRLFEDLEVSLFLPFDVKDQEVRFELPDGSSFNNPQGEIHHRSERYEGVGDFELVAHWRAAEGLRLSLGTSIPLGKTEDDPFRLGDQGREHLHIQFGTGTFDPLAGVAYSLDLDPFSISAAVRLKLSLYENRKTYRGPPVLDLSLGPAWTASESLSLSVRYVFQYQGRAEWDGRTDENSGYTLQAVHASVSWNLGNGWTLRPNVLLVTDIDVRSGTDNFEMEWQVGLSLEVSIPATD